MKSMCRMGVVLWLLVSGQALSASSGWQVQEYTPAAVDNPLKGLVPYAESSGADLFPHSLEFSYFPVSAVVVGPDSYDWSPLETFLERRARKGMQGIFRFYLEYPGKPSGVPSYLLENGLELVRYQRASTPPRPPVDIVAPNYSHPALRAMLVKFIQALGQKYDGDPRIGFITAGLLGHWGEWHSSPRNELFASKEVQAEVMAAYEAAFHRPPILLRYPAGEQDAVYLANATRPFGYHDDSFGWATLPGKNWYFMNRIQSAGAAAGNKWQSQPIGGEIRPEAWGEIFDALPGKKQIQNFRQCVEATHVSWLMDSGLFRQGNDQARRLSAMQQVRGMGYEYHVSKVLLDAGAERQLTVAVQVENRGVAPFYRDWPAEYALLDAGGKPVRIFRVQDPLAGLLPGQPAREWRHEFLLSGVPAGVYRVLLRIPNPLSGAKPLRFANILQDADLPEWLTLGEIQLP